jgi:predicted transposase YbfD/YdcC
MQERTSPSIIDHFTELEDPRIDRHKRHSLIDIIVLTVCAVISGAETWEDIEDYGRYKEEWLIRFLALPNGIPSHDTIRRLFIRLDPSGLQQCFLSWINAVREVTDGDVVAIDGKTLRRSADAVTGKSALHMISAWGAANGMVLGQVRTADHSNEITAIPTLLDLLKIKGAIVTIDAAGCQTDIAEKIRKKKADYVFAVKGNQSTLLEDARFAFAEVEQQDLDDGWVDYEKTVDKGHGRIEIREYYHTDEIAWSKRIKDFPGARSFGMVRSTRITGDKRTTETRYYISSLLMNTKQFGHAVRTHWSVENNLHWTLDMTFREDDSRMRTGYSAENFAMMRRIALSLVKRDTQSKRSLKRRRKICGYDNTYLERLLFNSDTEIARRPLI